MVAMDNFSSTLFCLISLVYYLDLHIAIAFYWECNLFYFTQIAYVMSPILIVLLNTDSKPH